MKVPNLTEDQLLLHPEVAVIDNGQFNNDDKYIDAEEELDMSLALLLVCVVISRGSGYFAALLYYCMRQACRQS